MQPRLPTSLVVLRWASTALLSACSAFWIWFGLAVGFSEGPASVAPVLGLVGSFLILVAAGVLWPRIGGILALLAAAFAAWYFGSGSARLLMALPLAVSGLGLVIAGPWARTPGRRAAAVTPA